MKKLMFVLAAVPLLVSMGLANAEVAGKVSGTTNASTTAPARPAMMVPPPIEPRVPLTPSATVSLSDSVTAIGSGTAGPAIIVTPPTEPLHPLNPPVPVQTSGFIQFNNLSVTSVSASNPPAEIVATDQMFIQPMMGAANASVTAGTATSNMGMAPTPKRSINCYHFDSATSGASAITCPVPPTNNGASYRIEVSASTQLLLRDRTAATLGNLAAGDQLNVYGYYNADGSIQAYLIRDISKPAVVQTIQLNNVSLVSISGNTLAVTQQETSPCYLFNSGSAKMPFACPMGLPSFSANAGTQAAMAPAMIAQPVWASLRKYAVSVDAKTIILDNNRTQISLASLSPNDQLNVYGTTSDNGQTVTADIIRDLSLPAMPSSTTGRYTGTVTSVNADGSFTVQTNGAAHTSIQVGASVTVIVP